MSVLDDSPTWTSRQAERPRRVTKVTLSTVTRSNEFNVSRDSGVDGLLVAIYVPVVEPLRNPAVFEAHSAKLILGGANVLLVDVAAA